ncbi:alpha/beta hydrolase [Pseudomonas sp. N040]|uniref:alpha/beta hydrolase n=1 Tax=Pseudomonas sp. N040 TaxID=2785325 RepID=UPI0018A2D8C0|nr:alpha/beta hydrolase [Pseudomonas sp. N040]MBF7729737.1 alpha/beta hydrolase [Pseudomonas sp. N040]MBW7013379.1 alpha/beta hydrolase [Pseudomonas sp. N040]
MKKLLGALLLVVGVPALILLYWMHTPQGWLTAPAAVIAKLAELQEYSSDNPSIADTRASRRAAIGFFTAPPAQVAEVRNLSIPGPGGPLPVRIYLPQHSATALPIILYFHGGGWVVGDLDSHDNLCRTLAVKTAAVVVSVDYRLAPEHAFPAALDDADAALRWVAENARTFNGDAARIAVAGDSAGGNLAAALSLLERDRQGLRLSAQVLIYPAVDLSNLDRQSSLDFAEGYFLTRARMAWFIEQYVPQAQQRHEQLASPLLASSHAALPPALTITAGFDPLRDEGEAYATALAEAGVASRQQRFEGVLHGFVSMDRWFPEADQATDLIAGFLREQFKTATAAGEQN